MNDRGQPSPADNVADVDRHFGHNVRVMRERREMTQYELAKRVADLGFRTVRQQTIKRIEDGEQAPKLGEAMALALALAVPIAELTSEPKYARIESFLRTESQDVLEAVGRITAATVAFLNHRRALADLIWEADRAGMAESESVRMAVEILAYEPEMAVKEGRKGGGDSPDKAAVIAGLLRKLAGPAVKPDPADFETVRADRERAVIEAMGGYGFSIQQIAKMLDLPVAHVRSTLGAAKLAEQPAAKIHLIRDGDVEY